MKKRKKYVRKFPNNPKKETLDKKIPFNRSVRRGVVLAFEGVCRDLGVGMSPMTEELLLEFINSVKTKTDKHEKL
jgi:hypothetical protein